MESFSNSAIDQSDFRPRINHTPEYNTYLYVKRLQCYNISGLSEQTWCMYKPTTQRSVTPLCVSDCASLCAAGRAASRSCRLRFNWSRPTHLNPSGSSGPLPVAPMEHTRPHKPSRGRSLHAPSAQGRHHNQRHSHLEWDRKLLTSWATAVIKLLEPQVKLYQTTRKLYKKRK